MIWLLPPSHVSKLDQQHTGRQDKGDKLLTGGEGWGKGGGEAKLYDVEKAWSSINHAILSGSDPYHTMLSVPVRFPPTHL